MRKFGSILCFTLIGLLCSCQAQREDVLMPDEFEISEQTNEDSKYCEGILRVKLSPEMERQLTLRSTEGELRSGHSEMDAYLQRIGALSMTRVFPEGEGAYARRRREAGLHLWYDIVFDPNTSATRAASAASALKGVEEVEQLPKVDFKFEKGITAFGNPRSTMRAMDETIPNDPKFPDQWHYHNDGSLQNSLARVDINALEAWKVETGDPKVIVAILDDGLDFEHPDLVANLWTNDRPEFGGDIHGYNFSMNQAEVDPSDHGTHVAGLVAATRNNNMGVAGVAGGDGTPNSGVRLMGLQIISTQVNNLGGVPKAFVYAADHGAVIAQNSWTAGTGASPSDISPSMRAGIDYFIKNAGVDPQTGEQRKDSPMKGGVVIFAAGNDNKNSFYMPSSYEPIIAVASSAASGKRAFYSNHGTWIDISAPGGDWNQGNPEGMILSTFGEGLYGYMQGTSMACPLVSGVAALILSKYGGEGFTNEQLKSRLLGAVRPFNIDEMNPLMRGLLGVGIVDAARALDDDGGKAPASVTNIRSKADYEALDFEWKAVDDEDDGTALSYVIYYSSDNSISKEALLSARSMQFNYPEKKAGDLVQARLDGLTLNTHYKLAIVAKDRWGHRSAPLYFEAATRKNAAPQLTPSVSDVVRLVDNQAKVVSIAVHHPDGLQWDYTLLGDTKGVTAKREGDHIVLTFRKVLNSGAYRLGVKVADQYGSADLVVPFEIVDNRAPILMGQPEPIYLPITKGSYDLELTPYFADPDGDELSYEVKNYTYGIVGATIAGNQLHIEALERGAVRLEVIARDPEGASVRMKVEMKIVHDDIVYLVYPVPMTTVLNIRLSDEVHTAKVGIFTPLGTQVLKKHIAVREDADRQVALDVSKLEVGTYLLEVEANGKVFKQNIIKN